MITEHIHHFEADMNRVPHPRGVALIEALVGLLVLALGMVSFIALQYQLRMNADVAKQRAEAVRVAQEDIENFRSYGTLSADNTVTNNFAYDSILTDAARKGQLAPHVVTRSNTTYTITRRITDSGVADMKDLLVTVSWADRTADIVNGVAQANQSLTLRSAIAGIDPALAASLAIAADGSPIRDLLGRDVQVPIPAKSLGDGTSVIKPMSTGAIAYVFDNETGIVTRRCTVATTLVTNAIESSDLNHCTAVDAYLLSGFIRYSYSKQAVDPEEPNDPPIGSGVAMRLDLDDGLLSTPGIHGSKDLLLPSAWPAVDGPIGTSDGYATAPECHAEALQTVRYTTPVAYSQINDGQTVTEDEAIVIAIIPQSVTTITSASVAPHVGVPADQATTQILQPEATGEKFVGYSCLVHPIDLDGSDATARAWTGRLTLWPAGWSLGGKDGYRVCRYRADYNQNKYVWKADDEGNVTHIDNQEHPYAYLNVQQSLSNQNFLVIRANKTCPEDQEQEVDGQGSENYTDTTTKPHQP